MEQALSNKMAGEHAQKDCENKEQNKDEDLTAVSERLLGRKKEKALCSDTEARKKVRDKTDEGVCEKIDEKANHRHCDCKRKEDSEAGKKALLHTPLLIESAMGVKHLLLTPRFRYRCEDLTQRHGQRPLVDEVDRRTVDFSGRSGRGSLPALLLGAVHKVHLVHLVHLVH